ncbi:MAG: hypothetical protein LBQ50_02535 [Planctomycetaceae bacterium]|nr:hypothetical protein [Planctomycetaceae bacterium]
MEIPITTPINPVNIGIPVFFNILYILFSGRKIQNRCPYGYGSEMVSYLKQ